MIRVPTPLIDAVRELSRLHREGHNARILDAISDLIAKVDSRDIKADSGKADNDIKTMIQRLEARVMALEAAPKRRSPTVGTSNTAITKAPAAKESVNLPIPNTSSDLLTSGEAYAELQRRGWQGTQSTFRRKLRTDQTEDLEASGLRIDAAGKALRDANPKDNRVQWLYFE
jgi:hypothetical protein